MEVHNMPVVQEAFFIPDDIATGLATGLYRRQFRFRLKATSQRER